MHIIDDIIDLSKLEANQVSIFKQPCNVTLLITSAVEAFHEMEFYKKKPAIELVFDAGAMPSLYEVNTDPVRLQQVLDNLISNAIKFTDHGTIEVGFKVIHRDEYPFLEFYVKDTGKGIPSEKCAIIFERFRQVEEQEYHEGSGLGLSICRALVELLGGEISVRSEVGMGSTFFFTIPYVLAQSNPVERAIPQTHTSLDLTGKKIIVAEDDADSWYFLKMLLKSTQASLRRAASGDQLMQMVQEEMPDLILLDINMPGKTGYECMREIREQQLPVKVIAQTAYAMADEQRHCKEVGCDGYLSKPYNKEKLYSVLGAVFNLLP